MRLRRLVALVSTALAALAFGFECPNIDESEGLIVRPFADALSQVGDIKVRILPPEDAVPGSLRVTLDGADITLFLGVLPPYRSGNVPVNSVGWHDVVATVGLQGGGFASQTLTFETVDLVDPDECEILNNVECLYPFPSSHFLSHDPSKPSGLQVTFPDSGLAFPGLIGAPPTAQQFLALDGFAPTTDIQMHFPGGVDLVASNAPRLIPPTIGSPTPPPYIGIRMPSERSLDSDSPSVLINTRTGERVLHFLELDARANGNPARQALIMRPGVALTPGDRYVVAIRNLVHPGGAPIEAESVFEALRDGRPSDLPDWDKKSKHFAEKIFPVLKDAGVWRPDVILAWDFQVQSDEGLTHHALDMRDMSFAWLEDQVAQNIQTFTVDSVEEASDACDDGTGIWRIVRGTYQVPLFLTEDPEVALSTGKLNVDADDDPVQNGVTNPPFTISIPCSAIDPGAPVVHPVILGHGLFGEGEGMVTGLVSGLGLDVDVIAGATNWRGLSSADLVFVIFNIVGTAGTGNQFENFPALPDRLKQGQINTVLLTRMMKRGVFNMDPAFQDAGGVGAFPGESTEMFYFGVSLGGIMGTWLAALTPDIERFNVDVPAMNFGMLLQRSTQFGQFELLLNGIGLNNKPMLTLLTLSLNHQVWVRSEPGGYIGHITRDPLPGTNTKKMMVTVAWLDKQVSNQATEIMVRSLGIPNSTASVQQGFPLIPDEDGPLDSAMVIYDTGSYDIFNPLHYQTRGTGPLIPPLANLLPSSTCDPHGGPRISIPASLDQLATFLQPGGQVESFCDGLCDASIPYERPGGLPTSCDPLN